MDSRWVALGGLIGGALAGGTVQAAVLKVPQQYTTIQAAVNAAQEGDTVRVAPGRYTERVVISGKAIGLLGAGARHTTIDANHVGRPLTISTTGTGQVTVAGFTLINGLTQWGTTEEIGAGQGGGVYVELSNLVLRDNLVTSNLGCLGTSVTTFEATITMTRNRIEANLGNHDCGQQSVFVRGNLGAESIIFGNVIRDHNVTGLSLQGAGKVAVTNNIFHNNIADWDNIGIEHGGLLSLYTEITLANNLFTGNYGYGTGGAYISESETGAPVNITGNSFTSNSSGVGPAGLMLASLGPATDTVVKNNQFDEPAELPAVACALTILVDESNVFASGREGALTGGCVPAE